MISQGVTFDAWRGDDFVSLVELLMVLGNEVIDHQWIIDAEFAPGWTSTNELATIADQASSVNTMHLLRLVSDGIQVIDGEFLATPRSGTQVDLILRSVRGDAWDVYTEDPAIRSRFLDRFDGSTPIQT